MLVNSGKPTLFTTPLQLMNSNNCTHLAEYSLQMNVQKCNKLFKDA